MKHLAFCPEHQSGQGFDKAKDGCGKTKNYRGELIEMRFLLTEKISIRCECYFGENYWISLRDSPELRNIAWRAIERIVSERCNRDGAKDENI